MDMFLFFMAGFAAAVTYERAWPSPGFSWKFWAVATFIMLVTAFACNFGLIR